MSELVYIVVTLVLAGLWLRGHRERQETAKRVKELEAREQVRENQLREMAARVAALEPRGSEQTVEPDRAASDAPVFPVLPPPIPSAPLPASAPPAVPTSRRAEDWETALGANWLNRIGALLLVVGLALFLGYSLTSLGPGGKIAIGFATGALLFAAGVVLERRGGYRNFGRGLLASGWAALYFTTYAAHGLPAARLIEDPLTATLLLCLVSAAILFHALRYGNEGVTGTAIFLTYITLNISPLTRFTPVAALVLAASVVVIARRFRWYRLATFGVVATYFTYLLRYEPSLYLGGLFNLQALLWIYWILFEGLSILYLREARSTPAAAYSLFVANAAGFLATSLIRGSESSRDWGLLFILSAAAYLFSAVLRARLASEYSGAVAAATALAAAAIFDKLNGLEVPLALLLEGELLLVAAAMLRQPVIALFGSLVLLLPFLHLLVVGPYRDSWMWASLLAAAVFFGNQFAIRTRAAGMPYAIQAQACYSAAATLLIATVLFHRVQGRVLTVAWAVEGGGLLAAGFLLRNRIFRLSGLALLLVCIGKLFLYDLRELDTLSRIFSFLILGVLLLGASWIYTRFRDQIRRLL